MLRHGGGVHRAGQFQESRSPSGQYQIIYDQCIVREQDAIKKEIEKENGAEPWPDKAFPNTDQVGEKQKGGDERQKERGIQDPPEGRFLFQQTVFTPRRKNRSGPENGQYVQTEEEHPRGAARQQKQYAHGVLPNARNQPVTDFAGVFFVTGEFFLQRAVFQVCPEKEKNDDQTRNKKGVK